MHLANGEKVDNLEQIKFAAADQKYSTGSKFSGSLVHKKKFGVTWKIVFNVE